MTKKFAAALCLVVTLSLSTSISAQPRDGGRGLDPIERIIRIIKSILHPGSMADPLSPHP